MSTRRTTERRRAALAAAVSLALHALLLAALLRAGVPRRAEPPRAPLVITLAPPPGAEGPADAGEGTAPDLLAPGSARVAAPRPLALRQAQGERQGSGPEDRGSRAAEDGRRPVDRDARAEAESAAAPDLSSLLGAPGSPGASASAGPDPLAPVLPRLGGEDDGVPPGPGAPLAPESSHEAAARGKRRLDAWLGDLVAVDRARNSPETYWSGVRGALERGPAADWKVLEQEDAVVSGTRAAEWVGAWLRAAEAYARSGSPRGKRSPGGATPEADARLSLAARGLLEAARPDNQLFVTELVTRVLVTVGDDGAVLSIALAESSGNAAHDRLVLARAESLRSGALSLGAPPRSERRTLWTVRTRFEVVPPVPVVGCGWDATFRLTGCFYPLKRMVHTGVRLEAVWDGGG